MKINFYLQSLSSSLTDLYINNPQNPFTIKGNKLYQAYNLLECSNLKPVTIDANANVKFVAGSIINLDPGFSAEYGSDFTAQIDNNIVACTTPGVNNQAIFLNNWKVDDQIFKTKIDDINLFLYPNPATEYITIGLLNKNYRDILFSLYSLDSKVIYKDLIPDLINSNQIRKIIDIRNLISGSYILRINISNKNYLIDFIKE